MKIPGNFLSVRESIEQMAVDITKDLVRFNNQNPPGNDREIAEYVGATLAGMGLSTTVHKVDEQVYAVRAIHGNPERIGMIMSGHLDVVPVSDNWSHDPFDPIVSHGRMYGRGACDMKSGLAAMIAAASYIQKHADCSERGLALVFNGDEEISNRGIIAIDKLGWLQGDAAVIGEPTECQIHLGNRGASIHHLTTKGVTSHASTPQYGVNAIYKMAEAVLKLRDYADELRTTLIDPHLGPATLSVGVIQGGQEANIVPDSCMAMLERRLLWQEDAAKVTEQIQQVVGDLGSVRLHFSCPASLIDAKHPLVAALSESIAHITGSAPEIGVFPASTEGAFFSLYNRIPTVICGPGSIKQAHTSDEWVEVAQIRKAVGIYIALAMRWLQNG